MGRFYPKESRQDNGVIQWISEAKSLNQGMADKVVSSNAAGGIPDFF